MHVARSQSWHGKVGPPDHGGKEGACSYDPRGHDSGVTLVEFAIVVPLLLLLIFGIVEMSRLVAEFTSIRSAAREGPCFVTTTEVSGRAQHYRDCSAIIAAAQAKSIMGDTSQISVTWAAPGYTHTCTQADVTNDPDQDSVVSGTSITVTVTSTFSSIMPLIDRFIDGIPLTTSQTRQVFVGTTAG